MSMDMGALPNLGAGLGYREAWRSDLFLSPEEVDFLEITADHFLDAPPEKLRELDLLLDHFTLIPHGLNLSLGSAEGLDAAYLEQLAWLVGRANPPWWSEHIAFTKAGGVRIGHLAPLPFSREALDVLEHNIAVAQERIPVPLLLENITYQVELPGAEMSEAAFLNELLDRTGCGLLLDVTNLFTNAVNQGQSAHDFLDELRLDRVAQLHFAGGHFDPEKRLIDSHAHPAPPEVWSLLEEVVRRSNVKGIILERDENLPPFAEIALETSRARRIMELARSPVAGELAGFRMGRNRRAPARIA